ncbi:GNAT family N-acetyltransferase [Halosegnis rubeus]|jgi:N-acetylglutamate synthase-like GNAT family acetyltransferase|uniref:GNAT family N-acetyltransferase n=1 Tax=Halosegnis rubeus TaxID=2212850 RepID=A0A5N5U2A3_9EURY|nr:GNAT family N-acetyltransferase [Halosegnis rubeus]KAB7512647.1 GNAT family N-acetyltransferase [Halosegnis rubeus]KAB7515526.1 GNAT family N-acetyltransferase [Halosegnis rubeus]
MYVRDARNRDEAWLLDHIEAMGLDDTAFRSRDYVIAVDDDSTSKTGFGRFRVHRDDDACELTSIGVLDSWEGNGVGAHIVERLIRNAGIEGYDRVYALSPAHEYLAQFGFEPVDADELPDALQKRLDEKRERHDTVIPMVIDSDGFSMPEELRERFKNAAENVGSEPEPTESPEDFGIDSESATYKYDTG